MSRRFVSPRPLRVLLAAVLGLSMLAALPTASASPTAPSGTAGARGVTALNDNGPLSAAAQASLLTLEVGALSPAILPQTNIDLGPSAASAASDQDLDPDKTGGQRSAALGSLIFNSHLLGIDLADSLDGIIANNFASAPPSEVHDETFLEIPIPPLLTLPAINSRVEANWENDVDCVSTDTPMSLANQTAADITLLDALPDGAVLELNPADGQGAVETEAATRLVSIDGPGNDPRAVQATTRTGVSNLDLLDGALSIDVGTTPTYIAQASGLPGGASVTPPDSEIVIRAGDTTLIELSGVGEQGDAAITDLVLGDLINLDGSLLSDLIADLGLPPAAAALVVPLETEIMNLLAALQPVVQASIPFESAAAADGTSASFSGALLRLEVLPPQVLDAVDPDTALGAIIGALNALGVTLVDDVLQPILDGIGAQLSEPLLKLELAPVAGAVVAPAGGIDCGVDPENPLRELNKHASATEVAPGGIFEYNISVPNRGPCALTDVVVTDIVTGPGRIIDTEPNATVEGNTATWDVGDLAVNETVNLSITVQVDDDATVGSTFDDDVVARGNCDGRPVEEEDELDDIPRVVDDFEGPCNVQFSNKDSSHEQVTVGQTFSYYVHAFNTGAEACTDVVITDSLDDRVSFVSCNKSCENQGQTVTWNLDSIPGGSSVILSVVVQVADDASGTLANTAIIDPGNGDPKTVNSTGPVIGPTSIPKDPAPAQRGVTGPLPKTGGVLPAALASLFGAGALGLLALRRRANLA